MGHFTDLWSELYIKKHKTFLKREGRTSRPHPIGLLMKEHGMYSIYFKEIKKGVFVRVNPVADPVFRKGRGTYGKYYL